MRKLILGLGLLPIVASLPAIAAPGSTTANVNVRSGPGSNYKVLQTLKAGAPVDVGQCDEAGGWCAVTVAGKSGFASKRYLEVKAESEAWPRTYEVGEGRIIIYQPQFTDWQDFKSIEALVAAQYLKSPTANPIFGVIGVKGKTNYDEDQDDIVISDITVTDLNFSGMSRDDLASLAIGVGKILPTGPVTVSEARVAASLAEQKRMADVPGLKADPPTILVSTTPAILVQTNGEPTFAPVEDKTGLSFVVNSNWDIFRIDDGGALFLRDDTHWLTAEKMSGPWRAVTTLPALLGDLPDDKNWDDARAALKPEPYASGAPKVLTASKPTELILFSKDPQLLGVPKTSLKWAANSESDVFFDTAGKQWYVLLSGRWFRAASLDGPWTFATPDLPADFRKIPDDAPYFAVRSSIPGTSESAEARLKASIPTTARVEKGSITPAVTYTGDPQFMAIESTNLTFATNTEATVIRVEDDYFLLQDGVWFLGKSPQGPWELATEVPAAIYDIPPSSPVYNATYVRVYDTEPDAVWYGYTMGYLWNMLSWGTYVYGTGWDYPPYWYSWPGYNYPIYYPRPLTWGMGAYYNPVRGVFGRYGYAYGPYRGLAGVRTWNPATGRYVRAAGAWGPRGSAGFIGAYNPRNGTGGYVAGGRNIYGSWKSAGVRRGSDWARITGRENLAGGSSLRWNTSEGGSGFIREGRRGNMYAGRDGNVYRNTGDGWQKFEGGGWQNAGRPDPKDLMRPGEAGQNLSDRVADRGEGLADRGIGDRGLGDRGGAALAGAAGGAAGAAIADRARPGAGTRPAARPAKPAARPKAPAAAKSKAAARPAARPQVPSNVMRDAQARQMGDRRMAANRQFGGGGFGGPGFGGGGRGGFSGGGFGGGGRGGFGGGGRGGGGRGGGGRGGGRR